MLISCNKKETVEKAELVGVVNHLKVDQNNQFLATLKPTEADLQLLFKEGESVNKITAYSNMKWADVSKIPQNSMKPITDDAELNILSVSQKELEVGITNGFPEEYTTIVHHLKDGVTLYAMQYLNSDGTEQKMRSAFFKVNDKWIIVPLPFRAF
jgi:hypothetical protein